MPPKAHARLGGSSSKRWMTCPGSVLLSEGIPDTTSSYAEEGTRAHELAEGLLRGGADPALLDHPGEMWEAVQVYVDFVVGLEAPEEFIEHQFDLAPLSPPDPMYGTSDYTGWWPEEKRLHVVDYKHGRGVAVDVTDDQFEYNTQMQMYALGAVVEVGEKPEVIVNTIVQPRADHPDGPVRTVEYDWGHLVEFKKELFTRAEAALQPNAELVVGDHCRFCKAKAICPAQRQNMTEVAQTVFDDEPDALMDPRALTTDQLGAILDRKKMVIDWLNSVESHVLTTIDNGGEVPGWKIVAKRATRKWTSESEILAFLKKSRIAKRDYTVDRVCSPAQAERFFADNPTLLRKLEGLQTKESSGVKLAPAESPLKEIPASVETVFD